MNVLQGILRRVCAPASGQSGLRLGLGKTSGTVRGLEQAMRRIPKTRLPKRFEGAGPLSPYKEGGMVAQLAATTPAFAAARPGGTRKAGLKELAELFREQRPAYNLESPRSFFNIDPQIFTLPGNMADRMHVASYGMMPKVTDPMVHRGINAFVKRHELAETAMHGKPGTVHFFSHLDPKVVVQDNQTVAALTGPGARGTRDYVKHMRDTFGEANIFNEAVKDVSGGRWPYAFGEKKLPAAMRPRVAQRMREIARKQVSELDVGMSDAQLKAYGYA